MSVCGDLKHSHKCKGSGCDFFFYRSGKRSAEVWEYKQDDRGDQVAKCPKCGFGNKANFTEAGIDLV